MPRAPKDPTKTAKDGTNRGRPAKVGPGKSVRSNRSVALPLTEAQQSFIRWYMVRRNITRAYKAAYQNASDTTAMSEGSKLFRDPRIAQEIRRLLDEEAKRLENKAQKVSDSLAAMAFTSLADVMDDRGNVIPLTDLPRDVGFAVKKVKRQEIVAGSGDERVVVGHTIEVEMHDKVQPLRMLGLEVGMFKEKVEHTADDDLLVAIREGRERARAA